MKNYKITGIAKYMDMHKRNKIRKPQYVEDIEKMAALTPKMVIAVLVATLVTIILILVVLRTGAEAIESMQGYESQKYNIYLAERGYIK